MEQNRLAEAGSIAVAAGLRLELLDLGVDGLEVGVGDAEHALMMPQRCSRSVRATFSIGLRRERVIQSMSLRQPRRAQPRVL